MENILLHVKYTGNESAAVEFANEITSSGLLEAIQREPGCLCYQYYSSLADSSEVLLTEIWSDQDSLAAHHNTDNMAKLKMLKDKFGVVTSIEKYLVTQQ